MFISLLRKEIKTMGKKYVPSGYQIINIDPDIEFDSQTGKLKIESDDSKILRDILKDSTEQKPIKKPVLLCYGTLIGFAVIKYGHATVSRIAYNGSTIDSIDSADFNYDEETGTIDVVEGSL